MSYRSQAHLEGVAVTEEVVRCVGLLIEVIAGQDRRDVAPVVAEDSADAAVRELAAQHHG